MQSFGATVIVGFVNYVKRLADVARYRMPGVVASTGAVLSEPGTPGDMIVSCLFTDDIFPIVRFNTHDVTEFRQGHNTLDLPFRRIQGFLGRSDNMVKLRGINVYPQALASLLAEQAGFNGEYLCVVTSDGKRDSMVVKIACTETPADELQVRYQQHLKQQLGVDVQVELLAPQSLATLTGVEVRQKPIRLMDER